MKRQFYLFLILSLYATTLPRVFAQNTVTPWLSDVPVGVEVGRGDESNFGKYTDLFDEYIYRGESPAGDMKYYVYDPVKHGADSSKTYPVFYWFHGGGTSFAGKKALAFAGAEMYASPGFQEKLGGAYIVFPLANERVLGWGKPQENGVVAEEEDTPYAQALKGIIDEFTQSRRNNTGKLFIAGYSIGGYAAWRYIIDYTETVSGALVMGAAYYPSIRELDKLEKASIPILVLHGYHDEVSKYETHIAPVLPQYLMRSNIDVALLEWVMDHDHKKIISFVQNGREQGQHGIPRAVSYNMMYDDGVPYSKAAPDGLIAWILKALE
jgi:predicted esterase